jgi:hypothetical protein
VNTEINEIKRKTCKDALAYKGWEAERKTGENLKIVTE